jgi:1-deoxy-D-xylulose-5-phosphate synthase
MDDSQKRWPKQDQRALLSTIGSPQDLKKLPPELLPRVAQEIRDKIISTVAKTGGHLAPSLGVVELTIALHYVFNTPRDKIVWDVGHQAYAHKLLTGRQERFQTLRQHGGLSGFPKRSESPYDSFDTGHSSTSVSAALGMACGRCLKRELGRVVAVIGDGALTAGLAYEGLNNAGDLNKNLVVVFNDNGMSIAPNVGALTSFFSRKLTGRYMVLLKKQVEYMLRSFPGIGEELYAWARKSEEAVKGFFTPGMLFEAMKFNYLGPVKGHRLDHLIETFENVKNLHGPVLVHVLTTKGKGYAPAENDPTGFHGLGKFDPDTGIATKSVSEIPSYTQVFGETLVRLAQENKKIAAITAAMPDGTGLVDFRAKFPDRFFDVGICELTTRSCTTSASRTCRWSSPWTGAASSERTGKPTRVSSTSRTCGPSPTWCSWPPKTKTSCATCSTPRWSIPAPSPCGIPGARERGWSFLPNCTAFPSARPKWCGKGRIC